MRNKVDLSELKVLAAQMKKWVEDREYEMSEDLHYGLYYSVDGLEELMYDYEHGSF